MTTRQQLMFGALVAALLASSACLGTSPTPSPTPSPTTSPTTSPPPGAAQSTTRSLTPSSSPGWINPCEVTVIGDSLGVGAVGHGRFGEQLSRVARCRLRAADVRTSRTTAQGAGIVERLARTNRLGTVVVVVLGANDCAARPFEAAARRLLAAAGARPVIWSTTWHKCAARVNAVLGRLVLEPQSSLRLVEHPAWRRGRSGDLTGDRLHLRARGAARLARALVDGIAPPTPPAPAAPSSPPAPPATAPAESTQMPALPASPEPPPAPPAPEPPAESAELVTVPADPQRDPALGGTTTTDP